MEIDVKSLVRDRADTKGSAKIESGQGRLAVLGTLWSLAVHVLLLPLGFLTTVFLTRRLGPELYGIFSVTASIILWVEQSIAGMFGQTTIKFVAEATNWQEIASALVQARLVVSLGITILFLAAAPVLASWLKSPELTVYLRLLALEIPIFSLAGAHLSTLTGRRAFGQLAFLTAVYGASRMAFVFLFVGLGFSLTGAIVANVGALFVQLVVARIYVRPAILSRATIPMRHLASYAWPLFLYTIGRGLFGRLDLLIVKALSEAPAAGYYGAAQNLTRLFGLFVASFTPPLLATLTRVLQQKQIEHAHFIIRQAMRLVLFFLPFVGMAAGSALEITDLVYGRTFWPTAPLLALLLFCAVANMMISVMTGVLTALGRPGWTFALIWPLLPLAWGAHLALVPRFGPTGAAAVTTVLSWLGASAMMLVIYRQYGVHLAPATILRITATTLFAYTLSSAWHTSGAWVILKLSGIALLILVCLFLLGELTEQDLAFARSLLKREKNIAREKDIAPEV